VQSVEEEEVDPELLTRLLREELGAIRDELVRIRVLLEQLGDRRAIDDAAAGDDPARAPSGSAPPAVSTAPLPPIAAGPMSAARTPPEPASEPTTREKPSGSSRADADEVELLRALLDLYPDDAAAVFYAFDRQFRCSPEHLDRLATSAGLDAAWHAANRIMLRSLVERYHGGTNMVAEMLGRDADSLAALVDRIGLRDHIEAVRARERTKLQSAPLGTRLGQLLFREKLVRDLGILAELDTQTRQDLQHRCAELSGECADSTAVLEQLAAECDLDTVGVERMLRRYDLQRFVADLFEEPVDSMRPIVRRGPRVTLRRPLEAMDIELRMLRMLLSKRKVGAAHTHIGHLLRTVPPHERGRARDIIDRLVQEGTLVLKVTDNSAEPHVSLAVAAVPGIERRLAAEPQEASRRRLPAAS
jgi:hypothetical protein